MKKPETTTKYQPSTIRAVIAELEHLNEEEQKELVHFIFDEIVRKSGNPTQITDAFDILKTLKPKYEERKQNFDDVRTRVEVETDPNIRTALLNGLALLTEKHNQVNKDFWDWVKEQTNPKEIK